MVGHRRPCRAAARSTDPGDGVQLGHAPGGDVALHRAAKRVMRHAQLRDRNRRVHVLGALRFAHRAGLLDRSLQVGAQLGRGANLAQQLVVGTGGARQRVQAHQLRPHHLRLGVGHAHRHARLGQRLRQLHPSPRAGPASAHAISMRRNWLVCTTTPGCGLSASTRIEPASTESGAKRSRSTVMWSRPFSSGSTSGGSHRDALQRRRQAGRLGGHDQRIHRLL